MLARTRGPGTDRLGSPFHAIIGLYSTKSGGRAARVGRRRTLSAERPLGAPIACERTRSMKRTIQIIVAVLALLVVGVIVGLVFVDSLARGAVERGASDALGVQTSLEGANVGVLSGTFSMSGLLVANPPGYGDRPFLSLKKGGVAVSLGTLMKNTIELPSLRLSGLDVDIERAKGKSNYGVILSHVAGDRAPASGSTAKEGPTFVVREVMIENVSVRVSFAPLGGDATVVTIPIERITLTDVGADKPLPMSELAGVLVQAVLATVVEQGGALVPTDLAGDLRGALDRVGDLKGMGVSVASDLGAKAEGMIHDAQNAAKGATEGVKKKVDTVKKSLRDLGKGVLPGKKKGG